MLSNTKSVFDIYSGFEVLQLSLLRRWAQDHGNIVIVEFMYDFLKVVNCEHIYANKFCIHLQHISLKNL